MRTTDRRLSKNVVDVPNSKLLNILTENTSKDVAVQRAVFTKRKVAYVCRDLFLQVLKLTKRPRTKYGKGKNKGTLKVSK